MKIALIFLVLLPEFIFAQQRYLVSPSQEVIPLSKSQSAAMVIRPRTQKQLDRVSAACGNRFTFGYTPPDPERFPSYYVLAAHHKEVVGEWFVSKVPGTIDTVFWESGSINTAADSILYLRIMRPIIGPTYGPGVRPGPFDPPCQEWGYWVNTQDLDQGIGAFPEDANPQPAEWRSTIAHGTSGPPFSDVIWGFDGYPVINHVNAVNHLAMLDLGLPCSVKIGDPFFISMRVKSPNAHVDDARGGVAFVGWDARVSRTDENYPSRLWKFYEHDSGLWNCAGVPVVEAKRGWVARGGIFSNDSLDVAELNWWYTMTVTANTPPRVIDRSGPSNTLSTASQHVAADIVDCNASDPGSAGVLNAWIYWSVNNVPQPRIDMSVAAGDTWAGEIPGQPAGSLINYFVRAIDANGAYADGLPNNYRVVGLENAYYFIDTLSVCEHTSIAGTGTEVDASKFFNDVPGTNPNDDGTAGPFPIPGGPMTIFGDTARYVWIGTNGAIALSKTAHDTLDLTSNGGFNPLWTFPMPQRQGRGDVGNGALPPGNMIAPLYADFIHADSNGQYGHIRYGDGGDPCRFIVEWDSLATVDYSGLVHDNATFRVILDRCDASIRYEYDIIGYGLYYTLTGMQADSNSVTAGYAGAVPGFVFLNANRSPVETAPAAGRCVVMTPAAAQYAKAGWNLLCVSVIPHSFAKVDVFPGASSPAFYYPGGGNYLIADTMKIGLGYWLKFNKPAFAGVPGTHFNSIVDTVHAGWNLIGTPSKPVPVGTLMDPFDPRVISRVFGYSSGTYQIVGTISYPSLLPGNGYWIRCSSAGTLTLNGSSNLPKEVSPMAEEIAAMSTLTIRDAAGNSQTLFLGSDATVKDIDKYEMPPSVADLSGFDVRFASGRIAETFAAIPTKDQSVEYPVKITSNAYPITVTWARAKSEAAGLTLAVREETGKLLGVLDGSDGMVKVANPALKTLVIALGGNFNVPKAFALSQNYPNPFNPGTNFSVDVPRTANVEMAVYDILGQHITTLLTGEQPAGRMTVTWDGRDGNGLTVPSGAYFVRMTAAEFTSVRKIMLMK